ncbi:MAG: DeoD-type purine-nucleoside phosphorylase [Candidatus Thermoplasmatota archaeon]
MPIHVKAKEEEVADTVLLPGNPERAKYIAENFFEDEDKYNDYRKMYGYTGTFDGKRVSVQSTGMGVPSIAIVLEELNMLGADTFIRVGTCGALQDHLDKTDVILGQTSSSIGTSINRLSQDVTLSPGADFGLLTSFEKKADEMGLPIHVGQIVTSDYFYGKDDTYMEKLERLADLGALAADMESSALYHIAAKYGCRAATVLTVSDHVFTEERVDQEKIQEGVDKMTKLVVKTVSES